MAKNSYYKQKYNETYIKFLNPTITPENITTIFPEKTSEDYIPVSFEIQTEYAKIQSIENFAIPQSIVTYFFPDLNLNIFNTYHLAMLSDGNREPLLKLNEILEYTIRNNINFIDPIKSHTKEKQKLTGITKQTLSVYHEIFTYGYEHNKHVLGKHFEISKSKVNPILKKKDIKECYSNKDANKIFKSITPILIHYSDFKFTYFLFDLNEIIQYSINNKITPINKSLEKMILDIQLTQQIEIESNKKPTKKVNKV